ncbi:MAG TPA: Hpt domain-containing protein, partial [Longimicrobium sp.]|nr:Hpt domain-containing protein [Longimicrobium sp.]
MNKVLVAGMPPDVPGLLARRLAGATVEDQPSPRDAADALRRESWTLAVVDASWLEPALVDALARLRVAQAGLGVLVAVPGDADLADVLAEIGASRVYVHPLDRESLARDASERLGIGAAPAGGGGAQAAGLSAAVAGVWAKYRDQVLARVDVLEAAAIGLLEGRLDREGRREAEREAHKLAGSVGTFGFAEASRLSREAETMLAGPGDLPQGDALR